MSTAPKLSDVMEDAISRAARAVQRRAQTLRDVPGETWRQDVEDYAEDIRDEIIGEVTKLHESSEPISTTVWKQHEANARLIAAAPDLLGALKIAKGWMQHHYSQGSIATFRAAEATVEDAISKAEGRA